MELATTTADFSAYTDSQAVAQRYLREAGLRYADYSSIKDYERRNGVYSEIVDRYVNEIAQTAAETGITLVQAHAPMGRPLADAQLLEDTLRCVDACGAWEIKNLVVHSGYRRGLSPIQTFEENKVFFIPLFWLHMKPSINKKAIDLCISSIKTGSW